MQGSIHTLMPSCPQVSFSSTPSNSTTTTMGLSDVTYHHNKPTHRRDNSGELDVFEAARYFSGGEITAGASFRSGIASHKSTRETRLPWGGGERKSIDVVPMRGAPLLPSKSHKADEKKHHHHNKDKKLKQPISPGGRLASFLNSLFHQNSSSKKKSKSSSTSTTESVRDQDHESPNGRRKRSSSIKSVAFCPKTHDQVVLDDERSKYGAGDQQHVWERSRRASTNGFLEKGGSGNSRGVWERDVVFCSGGGGCLEKKWVLNKGNKGMTSSEEVLWVDELVLKQRRDLWKSTEEVEDDGGESDSSSDLFELPNYDLPVYESTSMGGINKGAAMANTTV